MATRQGGGLDSSQGGGWIAYRAAVDGYKTGRRLAAYRAAVGCLQGGGLLLFLESALGRDTAGRKQGKKVSRGTFRIVSRGTLFFVK